jgi:hypothetical protein
MALGDSGYIRNDKIKDVQQIKKDLTRSVTPKLKKWAEKIQVGASVRPHTEGRKEGEVWTDADGKEWTKKNGLVQTVDKLTSAKTPWFCPVCEKVMSTRLDDKMYRVNGKCFDCVTKDEHQIRLQGEEAWRAYEKKRMRANEKDWLKDRIEEHETYIREFKAPTVYFENGGYEVLAEKEEFKPLFEALLKDAQFYRNRLAVIEQEEADETKAE